MKPKSDQKIVLETSLRESIGKGPAGLLRRSGLVPAVVYGEGEKTLSVQVPAKALGRILHTKGGMNALITLLIEASAKGAALPAGQAGKKLPDRVVLIKEIQHHPVTHEVLHVDFHHVSLSKEIEVTVPLVFKGEAPGVKNEGGVLEHIRWDLEIECLPTEIPSEIPVDIAQLNIGKTLHVRDVPLPAGVRLMTDPEQPVVACVTPKIEEEPPAEAAAEEEGAEPEVLKQKSPDEIAAEEVAQKEKKEREKGEKGQKGSEKGEKGQKGEKPEKKKQ